MDSTQRHPTHFSSLGWLPFLPPDFCPSFSLPSIVFSLGFHSRDMEGINHGEMGSNLAREHRLFLLSFSTSLARISHLRWLQKYPSGCRFQLRPTPCLCMKTNKVQSTTRTDIDEEGQEGNEEGAGTVFSNRGTPSLVVVVFIAHDLISTNHYTRYVYE